MTDRDYGEEDRPPDAILEIRPVEMFVDSNGDTNVIEEVRAFGDEEAVEKAVEYYAETTDGQLLTPKEVRKFQAFSSNNWHSAWEPEGPKPNWRKPPQNPELN